MNVHDINELLAPDNTVRVTPADPEGVVILSFSYRDPSYGAPQHLWCDPA